jgi:hypothetical protein
MDVSDWPRRQERRRGVTTCFGTRRHEDAVGHACVQVHMMVERRAEAVQKGDAAEPWAGGRCGSVPRDACGSAQQPLAMTCQLGQPVQSL